MMQQEVYKVMREDFMLIGNGYGCHYTEAQKWLAFDLIQDQDIRATARIIGVHRRTLQRWCRQYGVYVRRCPAWVYEWAERRRRKREFWKRRGYY